MVFSSIFYLFLSAVSAAGVLLRAEITASPHTDDLKLPPSSDGESAVLLLPLVRKK